MADTRSEIIASYMRQIAKAERTMASLPKNLRDLFDAEVRQNLFGTHVGNPQTGDRADG